MTVKKSFILLFVLVSLMAEGQKLKKDDRQLIANLHQHIQYLANDKLEGRRTGTKGEKLAAEYISSAFEKNGLVPKGSEGYLQPFELNEGKQVNPSTYLSINGKNLVLDKEYFPMAMSPNITMEAMPSMALQEPGMPWFYDLKELTEANAGNPHFDMHQSLARSARQAAQRGATAVFLYNSSVLEDGLEFNGRVNTETAPIPVIYITREAVKKYLGDEAATLDIKFKTDISEKKRTGVNVAGYINNGAPTTVIIGAHYDHLGYGEDGGSMALNKKEIHNGADDNASGIAAMIELSRLLKKSGYRHNNYLFLAFSGEEQGLYGSKYFTEHPTVDLSAVNYMINMDMVGRLNDSTRLVTVSGYGTSPSWGMLYNGKDRKKLYTHDLSFRFDSSGIGPSDHTSFYLKNIPVLFFFTGIHPDYHKPSDDLDKINYQGEMRVVKHILSVIETEDKQKSRLTFTKTRDSQTASAARFSVTLGILPDYTFNGLGVRVDGVSDNKPAQRAGLKPGDVILALGDYKTQSLESYMQALGRFKKGERTIVTFNRGSQTLSSTVEF